MINQDGFQIDFVSGVTDFDTFVSNTIAQGAGLIMWGGFSGGTPFDIDYS